MPPLITVAVPCVAVVHVGFNTSAGIKSAILALNASLGPVFPTSMVYVILVPETTDAGPFFAIVKPDLVITEVLTSFELTGTTPASDGVTVAELMILPSTPEFTFPVTLI